VTDKTVSVFPFRTIWSILMRWPSDRLVANIFNPVESIGNYIYQIHLQLITEFSVYGFL
jgi:hypothetical protein